MAARSRGLPDRLLIPRTSLPFSNFALGAARATKSGAFDRAPSVVMHAIAAAVITRGLTTVRP
jgi:hypothetical protein